MMFERVMPIVKLKLDSQLTGESKEVIELMRTAHAKMFESFEEKNEQQKKPLKRQRSKSCTGYAWRSSRQTSNVPNKNSKKRTKNLIAITT